MINTKEIIKAYAIKNPCYKAFQKMVLKGIIVHSTGCNNPYLKRYVDVPDKVGVNIYGNHWNNSNVDVCVHSFIGYDKNKKIKIAEILPYNVCCWGCGRGPNGSYNYSPAYIQFEICEDSLNDKEYFTTVMNKAIDYCVYLCKIYNIPIERIVSHHEAYLQGYASGHIDCDHWLKKFGKNMNWFRNRVEEKMEVEDMQTIYKKGDKSIGITGYKFLLNKLFSANIIKSEVPVNGSFGTGTETAVKEIQKIHGMKQTGEIDSKTANAIIELYIKYFQSGDFNNDGKINMKDVTDIQKKISHK